MEENGRDPLNEQLKEIKPNEEEEKDEVRPEKQSPVEIVKEEEIIEKKEEVVEQLKDDNLWIFFDYSGTLVNTLNALVRTYTRFQGKEFTEEQVKSLYKDYTKLNKISIARKYKFNIFKILFGGKKKIEAIRKEEFMKDVRIFPGISEVLQRLQKVVDAKLAIVTHETEIQDEEKRKSIFEQFGIPDIFDAVISDSDNKQQKFDEFIQNKGIHYGIIFGDLQFDLDLANQHQFVKVGVTWGFSSREEFQADYIISDPREILQIVMQVNHQIEQKKLHGDPI